MQHVIIGAGPAGVAAAETLRNRDPDSNIVLIGDEPGPPYARMAIPYYLIDKINEQGTHLRKTPGYFDSRRIDVRRDRITAIDTTGRSLTMASGGHTRYDTLLLATGSQPTKPPIPGIDRAGVHTCWTLADARHIVQLTHPGAKVVLMGAGFIGCIILEALAARRVELSVVEMEDRMVPRMMNEQSGCLIKRWCKSRGVNVHTSARVTGIDQGSDGHALEILLDSGGTLAADLLISATGVRPKTELADGTGIDVDHGIMVNRHLETSVSGVYAAGDVARGRDFSTGEYTVQAIQPTAVDHGRVAAANMIEGQEIVHQGSINMNVLDTMGLVSASFGLWDGAAGGDSVSLTDPDRYRHINLQFEDDLLIGANSLGLTQHIGVLHGLIQTRRPLGRWKAALMENPLNIMEAYLASAQGAAVSPKAV